MDASLSGSRLTDRAIRGQIHRQIVPALIGDSQSRVLDELEVCSGECRIDIAVINGKLHGIEIKSEADTLERLPAQVFSYNRVFDTMSIVCGENHVNAVLALVPEWWGVYSVGLNLGTLRFTRLRCPEQNLHVDAHALAQLLWKPELTSLLFEAGIKKGVCGKPKRELWALVAAATTLEELKRKVRDILKSRECWRLDLQQT